MASISEIEAILLTAVGALLVAVWGVITQRVVTRRSTTLAHLSRMDSDNDLIQARDKFIELTAVAGGLAIYADAGQRNSADLHAIRLVLNENERLALGIQFGILDREFVSRHGRGTLLSDWSLAAPFIYKLRAEFNNQALYHEFEELARGLQDRLMPRRGHWWRLWF